MDLAPFTPKQAASIRLARSTRIAIWEGAVRSAKTLVSLAAWADFILHAPPGPLLMAGRTTDTLRRNAIDPLIELLGAQHVQVTWGSGEAIILGRHVHLVGADNERAESRIRGLTLAGAYVDEVTILPQSWWQMLLSRMSIAGARILATTNPAAPQHWLLTGYLTKARVTVTQTGTVERTDDPEHEALNLGRFRFILDDNTTLDPAYVAALKASFTGLFYKRFILGAWVAAEGAVWPMLDPAPGPGNTHAVNLADLLTPDGHVPLSDVYIGIDHGLTNPTHAVATGRLPDGRIAVVSELRLTDPTLTVTQQTTRLTKWVADGCPTATGQRTLPPGVVPKIIIDPAAKALHNEWHNMTGWWPWHADNAVVPGLQLVGNLIARGRLVLAVDAVPELIREATGYVWDPTAQKRGEDRPLKVDDHAPDALRYAIMAHDVR